MEFQLISLDVGLHRSLLEMRANHSTHKSLNVSSSVWLLFRKGAVENIIGK